MKRKHCPGAQKIPDLLPCPFCGSVDVRLRWGMRPSQEFSAGCNDCGAFGPWTSREEAVASWNARAPSSDLSPDQRKEATLCHLRALLSSMEEEEEGGEVTHELRTHPEPFQAIWDDDKTCEIRRDDRGFKEDDVLLLREWVPTEERYTGRTIEAIVTHKVPGGEWGLPEGLCVMSILPTTRTKEVPPPHRPGVSTEQQVPLWDAVNKYAESCGGDTSIATVSDRRMTAVSNLMRAVEGLLPKEPNRRPTTPVPPAPVGLPSHAIQALITQRISAAELGIVAWPPRAPQELPPEGLIAVGCGQAVLLRDGEVVEDGEDEKWWGGEEQGMRCSDAEAIASLDPGHKWEIHLEGPLQERRYERSPEGRWLLTFLRRGFA